MLFTDTVQPATLELLKGIMAIPDLADFTLAGGTALALQIGHRMSYDLDFFGSKVLDKDELIDLLNDLGEIKLLSQSKNIIVLSINSIKVDFVNYKYPFLESIKMKQDIRLSGLKDICAMKHAAISGRGRKRDFYDIFYLLNHYSLEDQLSFYKAKYLDGSVFLVLKSLSYFEDADQDEELMLLSPVKWEFVKSKIQTEVMKIMEK